MSKQNTAKPGLTPEQQKAIEDEMRNNQAVSKRAMVAINLIPSIIQTYPNLSDNEIVEKATRITDIAMDSLLGIKFTKNE